MTDQRLDQELTSKVLRFLGEFDRIRQAPIRHLARYEYSRLHRLFPIGPCCECSLDAFAGSEVGDGPPGKIHETVILRVSKPETTTPPAMPAQFAPWIRTYPNDPDKPPKPESVRVDRAPMTPPNPADRFDGDPERSKAFQSWIRISWDPWAIRERPCRSVLKFYEDLFTLYIQLRRDSEQVELLWGFGLLRWQVADDEVWHPLITARVELAFDRAKAQLILSPTSAAPELATEVLSGADPDALGDVPSLEREFRKSPIAPWDVVHARAFLGAFANSLKVQTRIVAPDDSPASSETPTISPEAVLLLRRRRTGYARDIEAWLDFLTTRTPPAPVARVVGANDADGENGTVDTAPSPDTGSNGSDWSAMGGPLLFPLPSNQEQREVATRLATHTGVVVQGPPGCGKTHGVANLICHLLAHGKTILVTAQTDRALRVLRAKVPEAIRSLCVSVLGSDVDAQEELRESVQTIVSEMGGGKERHERVATRAAAELTRVQGQLAELWGRLVAAKEREGKTLEIAGKTWTPSSIGEYLHVHAAEDGWIPDPVSVKTLFPLTETEIAELFALLAASQRADLEEGIRTLPDLKDLPSPEQFRDRYETRKALRTRVACLPVAYQRWAAPAGALTSLLTTLQALRTDLDRALEDLEALQAPWLQRVRHQVGSDPARLAYWQEFAKEVDHRRAEIVAAWRRIRDREIAVTLAGALDEQVDAFTRLRDHVASGGGFGFTFGLLHGDLKAAREACRVDGRPPTTQEECQAVVDLLAVRRLRRKLATVTKNDIEALGAPPLTEKATEQAIEPQITLLRKLLTWREKTWAPLLARLAAINLKVHVSGQFSVEPQSAQVIEVDEIPGDEVATVSAILAALDGCLDRVQLETIEHWVADLGRQLRQGMEAPEAATLWRTFFRAWETELAARWDEAYQELTRLWSLRKDAIRFGALYTKLRAVAPQCAMAFLTLAGDPEKAVVPPRLAEAWHWRQLETWLTDHLQQEAAETVRQKIDRLQREEQALINAQVVHATWAAQIARVKPAEQQALLGWQQTIQKIGKGTGKRAGELKREAQRLMSECRAAVPVWIMPLSRVVENFAPDGRRFDVVITDESSQMDSFGILALLRAERACVIGDNMQISPAAVGVPLDRVKELMQRYLAGIPGAHLYDGQQSLYDLATRAFGGVIRLREHFRCVPEIIGFSGQFYNDELRPLRDAASAPVTPPVVLHRVDGYRLGESKVNPTEAAEVVALIAACCEHPAYADLSIGVVSLLGEDQAKMIYERLVGLVGESELVKRNMIVGDSYHFQGDERDIMILSLVEGPGGRPAALNRLADLQRFNVAASRAKHQMWIVHSVDADHFHAEDMRGRLLRYFSEGGRRIETWRRVEEILDDPETYYFQRRVARAIVDRGYAVRAEVRVGHFRIDLVVDGAAGSLAVECDGDRWHTLQNFDEDISRQLILERMGWRFVRVRGGQFFRNPEAALKPLWTRLEELSITPAHTVAATNPTDGIAAAVIGRAKEIRAKQFPATEVPEPPQPPSAQPVRPEPVSPPVATPAQPSPPRPRPTIGAPITTPPTRPTNPAQDTPENPVRTSGTVPASITDPHAREIYSWLMTHPGWYERFAIMRETHVKSNDWFAAIEILRGGGHVDQKWGGPDLVYRLRER